MRLTALLLAVLTLSGCQLYWTKPNGMVGSFAGDHADCATAAGPIISRGLTHATLSRLALGQLE